MMIKKKQYSCPKIEITNLQTGHLMQLPEGSPDPYGGAPRRRGMPDVF